MLRGRARVESSMKTRLATIVSIFHCVLPDWRIANCPFFTAQRLGSTTAATFCR